MYTVKEAAKRIGISQSLLYELISLGLIRHSRYGRPGKRGTIRIDEQAIEEYRTACEQGALPKPPPARRKVTLENLKLS